MSVCACANKHTHTYMHTHIYNTHITVSYIINISTIPKGMNPQHTGLMRIYKAYLNLATEHHSGKSNRSRNNNAAKSMATALAELRAATTKAQEACGTLEIDGALDQVRAMSKALEEIKHAAASGSLVPLPGETVSRASLFGILTSSCAYL